MYEEEKKRKKHLYVPPISHHSQDAKYALCVASGSLALNCDTRLPETGCSPSGLPGVRLPWPALGIQGICATHPRVCSPCVDGSCIQPPRPTRPCTETCNGHYWPWCPSPKPVPPPDCIWACIPVQAPVHPRTTPAHRHDPPSSQPCRSSAHPESTSSWPAAPCAAAASPGQESTCLCFSLLPVFCSLSMEQLAKRNCKGSTQLEAAPHVQRRCP